jgi:hypothetical protein
MGNERSYQVKIPSNQIIQRRFYSIEPYLELTQQNSSNSSIAKSAQLKFVLDPWFITGFTAGDGCLGINIYKDNAYKRG